MTDFSSYLKELTLVILKRVIPPSPEKGLEQTGWLDLNGTYRQLKVFWKSREKFGKKITRKKKQEKYRNILQI